MRPRVLIASGSTLLGVSAALLTAFQAKKAGVPWFDSIPESLAAPAPGIAIALLVLGLGCLALYPVYSTRTREWIVYARYRVGVLILGEDPENPRYTAVLAHYDDLQALHAFCKKKFPPPIAPVRKMKKWHEKNDRIFWKVVRRKSADINSPLDPRICGYLSLIPLTKKSMRMIEEDELDALAITTEAVAEGRKEPAAYYVGGVAGSNRITSGRAVQKLKELIEAAARTHGSISFYTRPVTDEGLRLAAKHGFTTVGGERPSTIGQLCKLEAPGGFPGSALVR